jgi:hypothetical protein
MAFQKQSITLKNFTWGISQDDFLTTWKQVLYAENLDINRDSYFVWLSRSNEWRFTTTASINWFFKSTDSVFAYTSDWKIYDSSWNVKYTFTWNEPILQAWEFNGYIYFLLESTVDSSYLHRVTKNSIILGTWNVNAITVAWDWFIRQWATFPVVVLLNELFYIWVDSSVYSISKEDVSVEYDIWDWDVVWITRTWSTFKVYTENWTVAFWDWVSNNISWFFEIWQKVRSVINNKWQDYVVAGNSKNQTEIVIVTNFTPDSLWQLRYSDRLANNVFEIEANEPQELAKLWNTIYFKQDSLSWADNDILSYWTLNATLSSGFNVPFTKDSNWNAIDTLHSLFWHDSLNGDLLYLWMNSNSEFAVERISITWWTSFTYRTAWYLQTNPIDFWTKQQKKKIEWIKIVTGNCDATNTIEIQYSIDWWAFTTLKTINSWTSITKTSIYTLHKQFFDISYKINFVWDWVATTPEFYEIQTIATNIE